MNTLDVVTPALPGMEPDAAPLVPTILTRRGNGSARQSVNPCVAVYGFDPAGHTCKTCARFHALDYHGKNYHKCELRGFTHGPGTDHRVGWPACARYSEQKGVRA